LTIFSLARIDDEEYLSALFSFCQELETYCVKRATELDSASVRLCLDLVKALNEKFLEFDFRNGPLRRKFDGIKYICKTLENIVYDLSIASYRRANKPLEAHAGGGGGGGGEKIEKMAVEGEAPLTPRDGDGSKKDACRFSIEGFAELKRRLDEYDLKREDVIKQCRDAQKASKQAIFSVHR
jgi:predicted translin family RNA/ssDNA-binding protein